MLYTQHKILKGIQLLQNGEWSWSFRICMRVSCHGFLKLPYLYGYGYCFCCFFCCSLHVISTVRKLLSHSVISRHTLGSLNATSNLMSVFTSLYCSKMDNWYSWDLLQQPQALINFLDFPVRLLFEGCATLGAANFVAFFYLALINKEKTDREIKYIFKGYSSFSSVISVLTNVKKSVKINRRDIVTGRERR